MIDSLIKVSTAITNVYDMPDTIAAGGVISPAQCRRFGCRQPPIYHQAG